MDIAALRDHASEMLTVIATDLETPQNSSEQREKSKGNAPADDSAELTAAEEHGSDRAESGFSVEQMVSEYRALRASVIRLWIKEHGALAAADIDDLTRFNEAIDQSLAESITRYSGQLDQSKEMFLAILGHDLRTPLSAVSMSAKFMLGTHELSEPHLTLMTRISRSSNRMIQMVGDLLDFTRSRLGGGIPIVRTKVTMEKLVHDVIDEMAAAHPDRTIAFEVEGDQRGEWDCPRLTQALTNVIGNALEHGSDGTTIGIDLRGDNGVVSIAIHNRGAVIPQAQIHSIFLPMKRGLANGRPVTDPIGSLGLGLYIAERIVHAHQGRIEVTSSEVDGTTFTFHLPRHDPAVAVAANGEAAGVAKDLQLLAPPVARAVTL